MGQQAYSDLPITKHVTPPISEVLGANPQKPAGIGTFKPSYQNTSMRVNGLNVIKGNYTKVDSGAGREIKVGNEQLPTDNLSITTARRLGTLKFSPQEATKCVILLSKLHNFDFTNILEYKQLNYEASDIIDIMEAKFNAENIMQTVGGEYKESISEKSILKPVETDETSKLNVIEEQVVEKTTEKDVSRQNFSQWETNHHISIITRSNNKEIVSEIKPATTEEIVENRATKILRSALGGKRPLAKINATQDLSKITPQGSQKEPEVLVDPVINSTETSLPLAENTEITNENITSDSTITQEPLSAAQVNEVTNQNILPSESAPEKPKVVPARVSSSRFMDRLAMSGDGKTADVTTSAETEAATVQHQEESGSEEQDEFTLNEITPKTEDENITTDFSPAQQEESHGADKSQETHLPEITEVNPAINRNEIHIPSIEADLDKKRAEVERLRSVIEYNRRNIWQKGKRSDQDLWASLAVASLSSLIYKGDSNAPEHIEEISKPADDWRKSLVLKEEATKVLEDITS